MISSLIRHSDLSSRHFLSLSSPPSVSPASPSWFLQRFAREIYRWQMNRCMSFCLWFVTGFSPHSFPPALFLYPYSLWEEAATRFSSFCFRVSLFSLFFCKGRSRRRRRRRNKTKKPKTTKKKKKTNKRVVLGLRFGEGGWLFRISVHLLRLCIFRLSIVSVLL
jgi:hypothetical protein